MMLPGATDAQIKLVEALSMHLLVAWPGFISKVDHQHMLSLP